jgi:hypothetical protein
MTVAVVPVSVTAPAPVSGVGGRGHQGESE